MNSKDWLKILGVVGLGLTGAGMFGMGPLAGMLGAEGAAAGAAAGEGLAAGNIASSGMFAGPSTMAGSGGIPFAPGMESLGAKESVQIAKAAGAYDAQPFGSYLKDRVAAELTNLNSPGEWATRLGRNLDRAAGGAGKMAAGQMMSGMFAPPPTPGPMPVRGQAPTPPPAAPQMHSPTPQPGGMPPDIQQLVQRARQGDPQAIAQLKQMGLA